MNTRFRVFMLAAVFFLSQKISATQFDPWFSELYLPVVRCDFIYERFNKVEAAKGSQPYTAYNQFIHQSLTMTAPAELNMELEFGGASTRNTHWRIEYFRATGRYLLMNDVGGESPVSCAAGLTFTFPWRYALTDISLMHHSLYDIEAHVSVGKEIPCGPYWSQRYWALLGYGEGTRGLPWIHGIVAAEKNFKDIHQFRLSAEYLRGLGHHTIKNPKFFHGYANVAHQSIDLIFHYLFSIPTYFDITFDYLQRVKAKNCPRGIQAASIGIVWSFSID